MRRWLRLGAAAPFYGLAHAHRLSTTALPSPTTIDKKSCVMPRDAYDVLVNASRSAACGAAPSRQDPPVQAGVTSSSSGPGSDEKAATEASSSSSSSAPLRRHGSHMSITAVGVVSDVQHGRLLGGVEVLQCVLKTRGYRTRQPGDLKMYENEVLARIRGELANATLLEGSRVVMRGTLSLHTTYDMVSKSSFENPVLDVGDDGYVGVLSTPPPTAKQP